MIGERSSVNNIPAGDCQRDFRPTSSFDTLRLQRYQRKSSRLEKQEKKKSKGKAIKRYNVPR